mmetsp:Transcript_1632/g.4898  ORF Transcript_1632/g.4898 Transcript_1632/m.4898 type:complete len:93 (+) Transcript_1632:364-642(+)
MRAARATRRRSNEAGRTSCKKRSRVLARSQGLGRVGSGSNGPETVPCVFLKDLRVDTVKKFGLDADLVADWHRLQALKQATKLAHPIPEDTA